MHSQWHDHRLLRQPGHFLPQRIQQGLGQAHVVGDFDAAVLFEQQGAEADDGH